MLVYHATTPKKLARYGASGCILPPVRYWKFLASARQWAQKTHRTIILTFEEPKKSYPLPDHQPRGHAWWSPDLVRKWTEIDD